MTLRTRLAPSPTGALHLGNARTFLINAALAAQSGGRARLRVDDLDGPRVKAGAAEGAIEDLRWLGIEWDLPAIYQSRRTQRYQVVAHDLIKRGLAYWCDCPRSKVADESPGPAADGGLIYGGFCRERPDPPSPDDAALRFRLDGEAAFEDEVLGPQHASADKLGDFVIVKRFGEIGYHLASVIDDIDFGIDFILRGEDLLASTLRQIFLYRALGQGAQLPRFAHVPLVVGTDGLKLAKRHGDTRLAQLREEGVTAGRVRAVLARWSGFEPSADEIEFDEWAERFDLDRLPREPVVYDDARDRRRLFGGQGVGG